MTLLANITPVLPALGRIRLGDHKGAKNPGKPLRHFRFSSNDEVLLKAIASQHGGEVKAWDGGEESYDLITEAERIAVWLPPDPLDVVYEQWGSGGLARRCDGQRCVVSVVEGKGKEDRTAHMEERDCACIAAGLIPHENAEACKLTVRLRVVLPDVPGLGIWMCTSHSTIAAGQLKAQLQLLDAMFGGATGDLIPADLFIDPRSHKRPDENYERKYLVPALAVRETPRRLAELGRNVRALGDGGTGAPALSEAPTAIGSGDTEPPAFTDADEVLAGPEWARKYRAAATKAGHDEHTVVALVAYATGGRTREPKAVLKTEVESLRWAFKRFCAGELAFGDDDETIIEIPVAEAAS